MSRFDVCRAALSIVAVAVIAALPTSPRSFAQDEGWRAEGRGRAITYATTDGAMTMTIRCASTSGYLDYVVFLRDGPIDLTPSPRGDGRMIEFSIVYPQLAGNGVYGVIGNAVVSARQGGHELVSMGTANAIANLAADAGRPATMRVETGGRSFDVPLLPVSMASGLERDCETGWFTRAMHWVLMALFYRGR